MRKTLTADSAYELHKDAMRLKSKEKSEAGRDIASTCPECLDPEIAERIGNDLRFGLETLFPNRFNLAWSDDHLELIADIELAINNGEQLVRAMPRGNGKTNILIGSFIVAIVTGKHEFAGLIGSTAGAAKELLESVVTELESNDILYAYFPELIHPIRCMEGIHQRKLLWNGEPIVMNFRKDRIILPSLPTVPGSSAIIQTAGLLGRIRGFFYTRTDGRTVRPTLVLVDDPQTDESAVSELQNNKRESVICGTIPGLAGPTFKVGVMVAVTVKAPGDLADRMLDRVKHPEWHGKRTALLRSIPTNVDLWNQYAEILRETQRADETIDRATDFYRENREAMDLGGEASWPARFNDGEISGIQFGMGLKITNPSSFASEYQNCPLVLQEFAKQTDSDKVVLRLSGRARGVIPLEVETLTAGVDVQKNYLVFTATGFSSNATPFVVDYGTFPDQRTSYFDRRSSTHTIEMEFPKIDPDAQLWAALDALVALLMGRNFKREDGSPMSFKKIGFDVRYKTQLIKKYIKQSKYRDILLPTFGIHCSPGSSGINERESKPGEISKNDFRYPPLSAGHIVRTASFDSAELISRVHDAINTPMGAPGALTLFNAEPHLHRCFVDQLCSEYSTMVEAKGRKKRIWTLKPNGGDNDFLDSTKISFVAAYVAGVEPTYVPRPNKKTTNAVKRPPRFAAI